MVEPRRRYPIREILLPALALLWVVAQDDHAELDELLPLIFEESPQTRLQLDIPPAEEPS